MWYFRLIQFALIVLLLIYYGTIMIESFTNREISFTNHDISDNRSWIPFYLWFVGRKTKRAGKDLKTKKKSKIVKPIQDNTK